MLRARHLRHGIRRSALLALPVLIVLTGLPLYVFPAQAVPARADVVYVLGSPDAWRISWAQQLIAEGHASALLISVPAAKHAPSTCTTSMSFPVVCVRPDPSTTDGEARSLRSAMRQHGWHSVIAITATPHITRAGLILRQCVPQGVSVVGRSTGIDLGEWLRQYAYQTAALIKAVAAPAC
jgi:hypothetical protein